MPLTLPRFVRPTLERDATFPFPERLKETPPAWKKSDTPGKPDVPPSPVEYFHARNVPAHIRQLMREGRLRFSRGIDVREALKHSCLSATCGFSATPGVFRHSPFDNVALAEIFRPHVTSREPPHIATVADVAWIITQPEVEDQLVERASFLTPLRSAEDDLSEPVRLCLVRRDPRQPGKRAWYVQPAPRLASTCQGDFPVLRVAYIPRPLRSLGIA